MWLHLRAVFADSSVPSIRSLFVDKGAVGSSLNVNNSLVNTGVVDLKDAAKWLYGHALARDLGVPFRPNVTFLLVAWPHWYDVCTGCFQDKLNFSQRRNARRTCADCNRRVNSTDLLLSGSFLLFPRHKLPNAGSKRSKKRYKPSTLMSHGTLNKALPLIDERDFKKYNACACALCSF